MKPSEFSKGWDERRVSDLLAHYETQSEEEAAAEDEAISLDPSRPQADRDGSPAQARTGGACAHRQARGSYLNSQRSLRGLSTATDSAKTSGYRDRFLALLDNKVQKEENTP